MIRFNISQLTLDAVKPFGLGNKEALRCKNMWTLGLALWMFDRDRQPIVDWLQGQVRQGGRARRGQYRRAERRPCLWRDRRAGRPVTAASCRAGAGRARPLPHRHRRRGDLARPGRRRAAGRPADVLRRLSDHARQSAILHHLSRLKEYGVTTFQAEDEIAAISAAIGASFAGSLGITSSSGPGIALKTEAMGLAIMTELPLVIVNSQRGGPSTGLPTKTEQSDLYQAVYGRNADSPMPVIAARSPADAFDCAIEACRIAVQYMTPVMLLTDGYIANAAEPWRVPDMASYQPFPVAFPRDAAGEGEAVNALCARRQARAGLDQARHAGADAPDRRHREECRHRPHRLCAREPPGDDRHPRRQGARHRQVLPGSGCLPRPGGRQARGRRLGLDLRPDPPGRPPRPRERHGRLPHPHPPYLAAAEQSRRSSQGLTTRSSCRK